MTVTPEHGISQQLFDKVVAFIDREHGRDAPLSDSDKKMVCHLIKDDPAVRDLAEDLRAVNAGLDTLLDDVADVEVPADIVNLILSAK